MRELQKMSAGAIQALPSVVPVKNGGKTVALLMPVKPASREAIERVIADLHAIHESWTDEQRAMVQQVLAERGVDI